MAVPASSARHGARCRDPRRPSHPRHLSGWTATFPRPRNRCSVGLAGADLPGPGADQPAAPGRPAATPSGRSRRCRAVACPAVDRAVRAARGQRRPERRRGQIAPVDQDALVVRAAALAVQVDSPSAAAHPTRLAVRHRPVAPAAVGPAATIGDVVRVAGVAKIVTVASVVAAVHPVGVPAAKPDPAPPHRDVRHHQAEVVAAVAAAAVGPAAAVWRREALGASPRRAAVLRACPDPRHFPSSDPVRGLDRRTRDRSGADHEVVGHARRSRVGPP